jgi:hypothetical protein
MAQTNPYTSAQQPLAMQLVAPDIAAQQMQLTRQQQVAQMLRDQSMTPSDPTQVVTGWAVKQSPLLGLTKVIQALGGAYMQKQTDAKQLELAKALQGRMGDILGNGSSSGASAPSSGAGNPNSDQPQYQSDPNGTGGPLPGQLGSGMMDAANPNIAPPVGSSAAPVVDGGGQPVVPPAGPVPSAAPTQVQGAPAGATPNNYNLGNLLKGSVIGSIGGDPAAKSYWDQFSPTDATKLAMASGADPRLANQAALNKANYIAPVNARPGSILRDPITNMPLAYNPHVPDGATPNFDASGNVVSMQPIPNTLNLMQQSAQATAAGKAAVTPVNGFDANGKPVFTNQLAAAQGGQQPNVGNAQNGTPAVNTGHFGGYAAPGGNGVVTPGLAPGVATAAEDMAAQNTKRSGALVDAAADSPTRVNVLDNIINLSKNGVNSGPTADWVNQVKGSVADLPGMGAWKDDVTGFQELKKYMNQNGLRAWQAAGGTGSDSQLSAAQQANPNDHMFPQAVQTMANWAKAGELALQSKATAQDSWLARNNNNPQSQNQFESVWRQNYDPRIYQMKMMNPTQLQTFTSNMAPADKASLLQKYSTAKQNGWIQ